MITLICEGYYEEEIRMTIKLIGNNGNYRKEDYLDTGTGNGKHLKYAQMSIIHEDWGTLTAKYSSSKLSVKIVDSIPAFSTGHLNEIWEVSGDSFEDFKTFILDVQKHKAIINLMKINIKRFPTSPKFIAHYEAAVMFNGSVSSILVNHSTFSRSLHVSDGLEKWSFLIHESESLSIKQELDQLLSNAVIKIKVEDIPDKIYGVRTLTDYERDVILTAYRSKYFQTPRGSSADYVSNLLGVDKSSFSRTVRHALEKIVENYMESNRER